MSSIDKARGLTLGLYLVYIIYSPKLDRYYVGVTNDMEGRLRKHNNGEYRNAFTRKGIPRELYFLIEGLEKSQAYAMEKHIKKMHSRNYLKNLKQYPEMVQRLKKQIP